jgi:hypothetical protein
MSSFPFFLSPFVVWLAMTPLASQGALIANYDIIDQKFNSANAGYNGPGRYDLFNAFDATATPDGFDDIEVVVTSTGFGTVGGVTYAGSVDDGTTTGLVSTINTSGASALLNSGRRTQTTVDIRFLPTMTVTAANVVDYSFSSGNTAGITWETTYIQYLDLNYLPIGATPTLLPFLNHTSINGQVSNSYVADSKSTVLNVGTNPVTSGTSGSNDNSPAAFDTPVELGITASTRIGGVRFVHMVEDTRGPSNGNSSFTSTINDLELQNFTVVPEPTVGLLMAAGGLCALRRRRNPVEAT